MKSNKSLDNIRNTQAGHIQTDYRIACAMLNFTHKPSCPDGENAAKIAKRMRKKFEEEQENNQLESFLSKHLGTKEIIEFNIGEINDFPKFTPLQIQEKITFGSFHLRQSVSYLKELLEYKRVYKLCPKLASSENCLQKLISDSNLRQQIINSKAKLIAVEIAPRHKRGQTKKDDSIEISSLDTNNFVLTYKIFLVYAPNIQSTKSILGEFSTDPFSFRFIISIFDISILF